MVESRGRTGAFGPGVMVGVGLGGLLDGIVLHQLLGWHHLLSARPGFDLRANEVADGIFHAGSWLVVLAGVAWLYSRLRTPPVAAAWPRLGAGPRSWRRLIGPLLLGWGAFNVVEGIVDHHLLGLHHVRGGPDPLVWDLAFLAVGAVLAAAGWWIARLGRDTEPRRPDPAG